MLFRSVAKCSAYGTNAMHCTSHALYQVPASQQASKHRECSHTPGKISRPGSLPGRGFLLVVRIPNPLFSKKGNHTWQVYGRL